jgi:hypothetical protein
VLDYAGLQQRVATDLNRPDLLLPVPPSTIAVIPEKIQSRIAYFSKSLFAPSAQLDYSITTVAHQNIYPIPSGMQSLTNVRFMLGSIWLPVIRVPYELILAVDVINPPFVSIPSMFAQRGLTFRLFATPDRGYPLELECNLSPPPPVTGTDVNFWTNDGPNDGGNLIVPATCEEICRRVLNDIPRADQYMVARIREETALQDMALRMEQPLQMQGYL